MPIWLRLWPNVQGAAQLHSLQNPMVRIVNNPATTWSNTSPRVWWDFHLPALRQLVRVFMNWKAARRAERELHALDDRTLKDIGLTRWEIRGVVPERQRMSRVRPLLF